MSMDYTLSVTSQGQVSIPAKVRRLWGLMNRGQITLTLQGKKGTVEPISDLLSLGGSLNKYAIRNKNIEEIMKIERKAIEEAKLERAVAKLNRSKGRILQI